jgi:hypothetical protein
MHPIRTAPRGATSLSRHATALLASLLVAALGAGPALADDPAARDSALVGAAALSPDPALAAGFLLEVSDPAATPGWVQAALDATSKPLPLAVAPAPLVPQKPWWRAAFGVEGDSVIFCSWNHQDCFAWDPAGSDGPIAVDLGEAELPESRPPDIRGVQSVASGSWMA